MLPIKLTLKNVGPFKDETIDFSSIPGDVIAIIGENGSGKTFLMDSCFAALYRFFPSRDSIYKYCQGKDARIVFEFMVGKILYKSVININAIKREMEPFLYENGSVITDGKNNTFDAAIKKIIGSSNVILTSAFRAQNKRGSFLELPKAERKSLFIEMLGLGRLQKISELATVHEEESTYRYEKELEKLESLKKIAANKIDTTQIREKIDDLKAQIDLSQTQILGFESTIGELRSRLSGKSELESRAGTMRQRIRASQTDHFDILRAIEEAELYSKEIDSLRKQVEAYDDIVDKLAKMRVQQGRLTTQQLDYSRAAKEYSDKVLGIEKKLAVIRSSSRVATQSLSRSQTDSAIIDSVPCRAEGDCAECQFLVNAIGARDKMEELVVEIDNLKIENLALDSQLKGLTKPDTAANTVVERQISELKRSISASEKELESSSHAGSRLAKAEAAQKNVVDLSLRKEKIKLVIGEIEIELATINGQLESLSATVHEIVDVTRKRELETDILDGIRSDLNSLVTELARAEATNDAFIKAQSEIDALLPNLSRFDSDRKSYKLLAKAFSKTGIQSLEIDAAGPTVSSIANDLLFSCFGPRFSIRFVTQAVKEDKSGYKDDFDIFVTDSQTGREGSIDDLSGGEQVITSEVVSLAIALFNRSRSNTGWMSLWRDEASSAIDDQRAPLYIKMLRKAKELGMFSRLIFICHQARLVEMADSVIRVENGRIKYGE
jgi:exonuclease SbcC